MSEHEGEFKKRIKAFRNNTNRLKVFSDEEATMIQNSMVLLVEEAKQDLEPEFSECAEPDGTDTLIVIIELSKWEKWFGAAAQHK